MKYEKSLSLDLVRIMASVMVLTCHIGQIAGFDFSVGASGVQLFFVLSGYLAFCSLEHDASFTNYYKKRLLKILPTYWICLGIVYMKDILKAYISGGLSIFSSQCGIKFLRYVFFIHCVTPSDNWELWNNHSGLWTMSSFAVFYLLVPLLYKLANRFNKAFLITGVVTALTPSLINFIKKILINYPVDAYIDGYARNNPLSTIHCFLMGCTLFLAIRENKHYYYGTCLLLINSLTSFRTFQYELCYTVLILFASCLQLKCNNKDMLSIIDYGAKGSFTLYLIHPVLLELLVLYIGYPSAGNKFQYILFAYILCIVGAYAFYFCVVSPVEKRIRKIFYK